MASTTNLYLENIAPTSFVGKLYNFLNKFKRKFVAKIFELGFDHENLLNIINSAGTITEVGKEISILLEKKKYEPEFQRTLLLSLLCRSHYSEFFGMLDSNRSIVENYDLILEYSRKHYLSIHKESLFSKKSVCYCEESRPLVSLAEYCCKSLNYWGLPAAPYVGKFAMYQVYDIIYKETNVHPTKVHSNVTSYHNQILECVERAIACPKTKQIFKENLSYDIHKN